MYYGDLIAHTPDGFSIANSTLKWQMSRVERFAFIDILSRLKPDLSLEIGTDQGGSLEAIMQYSSSAISIDINLKNQEKLKRLDIFRDVQFLTGNSALLLPELIQAFQVRSINPDFILIDGDHSTHGALRDINSILSIKPIKPICVMMHDSFMPSVREAILNANWTQSPYVHYLEVDYAYGSFVPLSHDAASYKLVGGLAMALLKPIERRTDLEIFESNSFAYKMLLEKASNR